MSHYATNRHSPPRGHRDDYREDYRDLYRDRDRDWEPSRERERDRDRYYHRSRTPSRSRSPRPPRDAPRGPRGPGYYDRDAPMGSRSRSRSPPVERFISRDVIIDGFGGDIRDDDVIQRELVEGLSAGGVEKVTLIKDRKTGLSRGFAFVHFSTTRDSTNFMDLNAPHIYIGDARCRINFSKERDESDRRGRRRDEEGEEWRCRVCLLVNYPRRQECFRCSTPRSEVTLTGSLTHPTPTSFMNDGERDMATSPPSQFLLFRNLEAPVNEELLAKGVLKLAKPACPDGASEASLTRVLLVRDRKTNESWRYGFAEFSSSQEAQSALKAYEKMEKFTISSRPVTVSYIHPGVFVPVYNAPKEAEQFTFLGGVNGNVRLAYWDEEGYVSEFAVAPPPASEKEEKKESAKKKAKATGADAAIAKKRKAESTVPIGATPSEKKKTGSSATLPAHLQFWQNRHSELHGLPKQLANSQKPETPEENETAQTVVAPPQKESFADMNKLACLLCARQFKTAEKLHEHERVSTLHATNLKSEETKAAARKKLAKIAGASASATPAQQQPEYRDRAKERREVFGNPEKQQQNKKQKSPEPEEKQQARGAALLGKMGWTAGQGLGASGDGRTEHVVAEVYTQGAGLGMKGAKIGDVETAAKEGAGSYGEFVRKTKERAKERFQGMD